jgi:hypothetical protein
MKAIQFTHDISFPHMPASADSITSGGVGGCARHCETTSFHLVGADCRAAIGPPRHVLTLARRISV